MTKFFIKMPALLLISFALHANEAQQQPQGRLASDIAKQLKRTWMINIEDHTKSLREPLFSPDGKKILTLAGSINVILWNAQTGKNLRCLPPWDGGRPEDRIISAQFSPDSKQVLTASYDGKARIWDVATGAVVKILYDNAKALNSAQFSPNGTKVVTASTDKTARIFDVATGQEAHTLEGHTNWVLSAQFSPDGTKVITGSKDNTAIIWDVENGTPLQFLQFDAMEWIKSAQFSPNGTKAFTLSKNKIGILWDVETGQKVRILNNVDTATFSPDGNKIVTTYFSDNWRDDEDAAQILDANTGLKLRSIPGHQILNAAFSHDSKKVVICLQRATAQIWNAETGELADRVISTLTHHAHAPVHWAVFSPDDSKIVIAGGGTLARIYKLDHAILHHYFSNPIRRDDGTREPVPLKHQALLVALDAISQQKNGAEITKADLVEKKINPGYLFATLDENVRNALKSVYHLSDDIFDISNEHLITQIDLANQKGDA